MITSHAVVAVAWRHQKNTIIRHIKIGPDRQHILPLIVVFAAVLMINRAVVIAAIVIAAIVIAAIVIAAIVMAAIAIVMAAIAIVMTTIRVSVTFV